MKKETILRLEVLRWISIDHFIAIVSRYR